MKYLFILLFSFLSLTLFSQTETVKTKRTIKYLASTDITITSKEETTFTFDLDNQILYTYDGIKTTKDYYSYITYNNETFLSIKEGFVSILTNCIKISFYNGNKYYFYIK